MVSAGVFLGDSPAHRRLPIPDWTLAGLDIGRATMGRFGLVQFWGTVVPISGRPRQPCPDGDGPTGTARTRPARSVNLTN